MNEKMIKNDKIIINNKFKNNINNNQIIIK
jgi:hypothetical protein